MELCSISTKKKQKWLYSYYSPTSKYYLTHNKNPGYTFLQPPKKSLSNYLPQNSHPKISKPKNSLNDIFQHHKCTKIRYLPQARDLYKVLSLLLNEILKQKKKERKLNIRIKLLFCASSNLFS